MKPSRSATSLVRLSLVLGLAVPLAPAQGFTAPFLGAPEFAGNDVSMFATAAAADLDGDGLLEYLAYEDDDDNDVGVLAFVNLGSSFAAPILYFVPMAPLGSRYLRVADLDGDGALDVLSAKGQQLFALPGLGDGTLAPHELAGALLPDTQLFDVGDIDADGHVDVVLGTFALGKVPQLAVAPGLGDGTLAASQVVATIPGSTTLGSLQLADMDQDGRTDLLAQDGPTFFGLQWLDVFRGTGGLNFQHVQQLKLSTAGWLGPANIVQLDGDGLPDLLLGSNLPGVVTIHGAGGGLLAPPVVTPLSGTFSGSLAVDVDLDGCVDLLGSNGAQRLGPGGQLLGSPIAITPPADHATWADFDGDALPDAMTVDLGPWPKPAMFRRNILGPTIDLGYASPAGPSLQVTGAPVANGPATLLVSGPASGTPSFIVLGSHPVHLTLGTADLVPSPEAVLALPTGVPLNTRWPSTLQPGAPIYVQAAVLVPAPSVSQALVIVP